MQTSLSKQTIEIPCENCGRKTAKSIGWVKANKLFVCACGTNITLDASKLNGEIAKVERSLKDLEQTLKKLGG
ncbi:hypothetical protein [Roseiconus lacunae]|uniref:Uncharacterized protein n=1 Tax=Roseiconus lacunae TaxID=2605694 RepID=A0ABT7PEQ4_9BACT|nr:hypothetical protein [Roseiconus lacunae]MDM4014985.1 hypothetical protein [Roseiconus lacunae]